MSKNKLIVVTLGTDNVVAQIKKFENSWNNLFYIKHIIDSPENIKKYLNHKVDVLILEKESIDVFDYDFYRKFKDNNNQFLYVVLAKNHEPNDSEIYKKLVDQIVYLDCNETVIKWNLIAILRRYWDTYSKPTTIIYKKIIADFLERKFYLNGELLELTLKEMEVLKYLIEHRGEIIPKNKLYKEIWRYDIEDGENNRTLDQIIFKLKKKLNGEYLTIIRKEGVCFE